MLISGVGGSIDRKGNSKNKGLEAGLETKVFLAHIWNV